MTNNIANQIAEKIVSRLNDNAKIFGDVKEDYNNQREDHENRIFSRTVVYDDGEYTYHHTFEEIFGYVPEDLYWEYEELTAAEQIEVQDIVKDTYPDWRQ